MTYFEPIPLGKPVVPQPPRPPSMPAGGGRLPAAPRGFRGVPKWARAATLAEWHETWAAISRNQRVTVPRASVGVPLGSLAVPIAALGLVVYGQNLILQEHLRRLSWLQPDARWPFVGGAPYCPSQPALYVHSPMRGQGWFGTNCGEVGTYLLNPTNYPNGQYQTIGSVKYANYHWWRTRSDRYNSLPRFRVQWAGTGNPVGPVVLPASIAPMMAAPAPAIQPLSIPWRYVRGAIKLRDKLAPREDLKPSRESPPWKPPRPPSPPPAVGVGVDAGGNITKWVMPPHRHAPPPRGVKERKSKLGPTWGRLASVIGEKHARMAKGGIDAVTETLDFIEALYYALPPHYRVKDATPQEMVFAIYEGRDALDLSQMLTNLAVNEVNDRAIGILSNRRNSSLSKAGFMRRFMEFYGPAI